MEGCPNRELSKLPMENPKYVQALKDGKAPLECIPLEVLDEIAWAMAQGRDQYGRFNWRLDPILATTYVAAIGRHALLEWASGVDRDKKSGCHPLAHVAACCMIVLDSIRKGTLVDDRLHAESKKVEQAD